MKQSFHGLHINTISLPCYFFTQKSAFRSGEVDVIQIPVIAWRLILGMSVVQIPNQNPEGGKTSLIKRKKDCEEMQPHAVVQYSAERWLLQGQRISSGRFLVCFSYFQRFLTQQLMIWLRPCKTVAQARRRNLSHGRSSRDQCYEPFRSSLCCHGS